MSLLFHIVCVLAHHRAASLPFLRQGRAAWWCSLAPHLCQNPQIIIFKFEWILNNIAALAVGVVKALSLGVEAAWWTGPSVFYLPMWVNSCCSRWESKENTSVDLFSPDCKKKKKRERHWQMLLLLSPDWSHRSVNTMWSHLELIRSNFTLA